MDGPLESGKSDKVVTVILSQIMLSLGVSAHLDEEEAGCRGGVMVDVDGDQHAGNHDEHHQQDAEDQAGV